jgi:hypothetical protein
MTNYYFYEDINSFYLKFLSQKPNISTNPEILNNESIKEELYNFFKFSKINNPQQEFTIFKKYTTLYHKLYKIISVDEEILKELNIPSIAFRYIILNFIKNMGVNKMNYKKSLAVSLKLIIKNSYAKTTENELKLYSNNATYYIEEYFNLIKREKIILI